ncbi:MAG: SCO family protein [Bacteroidota bacterium]
MPRFMWMFLLLAGILAPSCEEEKQETLPIMGQPTVVDGDTIPYTIPAFALLNQDSSQITNSSLKDKVFVADFFFTSCPTICPRMKAQMLRVQKKFAEEDQLMLVSHSIDPEFDQVPILKTYADRLGVKADKWHLLTGDKEDIYKLARSYMVTALEDSTSPGGYAHSGAFILVDKQQRIRGFYDGTLPDDVNNLMDDIEFLLGTE